MSKTAKAIKLQFTGGLHIGRGAEELDKTAINYSSDALKSALYAIGLPYYPQWIENHKSFFGGFSISSAFPWCNNEYFLPKPGNILFKFENADELSEAKSAKKISYISSSAFRSWALNPSDYVSVQEKQLGDGTFLFEGKGKKFLYSDVQQRVQVHMEDDEDTLPFYFERIMFEKNSGLYFLISFEDEKLMPQIMHALELLGNVGIGTDRTVGNGQFEIISIEDFMLPEGKIGVQMCLGLYLPTEEELASIDLDHSYWNLVKRGGYIALSSNLEFRSLRKNNIYFLGEGSAFSSSLRLNGRYVDLQPKWNNPEMHPVWRDGSPLFINL
ncbi:MAG: type III-A CRISPR-associated RAMP protein Csm4 [Bacteroidetes bacterium]|nr:type III-A CRISPR-associated RAMP protein Csm4 [Bacteroidota bacterium]